MKKVLTVILLLLTSAGIAYAAPVPDTGQDMCFSNDGPIWTCPQPGEPFYGQDAHYTINPPSYTDFGNGIVRENVTGLQWIQDVNLMATRDPEFDTWFTEGDGMVYWQHAMDYADKLNNEGFLGHNDWRIPNTKELSTLYFSDTAYLPDLSYFYWTSDDCVFTGGNAWTVGFEGFSNGVTECWPKTSLSISGFLVKPLRAGQTEPVAHFIDNGDGTVTDTFTGLVWQQQTAPGTYTWEQALAYCEGLELAGRSDWRLPNRNELQSLVDVSVDNPSIDTTYFPDTSNENYWSSTTNLNMLDPRETAWSVDFKYGYVGTVNKTTNDYVRAVRGGKCGYYGDTDNDDICDDGDVNAIVGDNPCTSGNTVFCDDNCPDDSNPDQTDRDGDGIGGACDPDDDLIPPAILTVTTNQGPDQSSIPLNNGACIPLSTTDVIWTSQDPGYPDDGLGWASRKGVGHTYFSYKLTTDTIWQADQETAPYGNPGFYGQWSWIYPTSLIGADGDYDIRLAAEDEAGNRSEVIYEITIDTSGTDTDEDGILDCVDNCPAVCNQLQLDADLDGIGDLCDPEPGCGEGCQPACEQTCPVP